MRQSNTHTLLCSIVVANLVACGAPATDAGPKASTDTTPAAASLGTSGTAGTAGTTGSSAAAPDAPASTAPVTPRNPLTGEWTSTLADIRITQDGDTFTGELCADRPPCTPIRDGKVGDRTLTATLANRMDPTKVGGMLEFTLAGDGKRMMGRLVDIAQKAQCEANPTPNCNFEIPLSLTKDDGSDCESMGATAADVKSSAAPNLTVSGKWRAENGGVGVMFLDLAQTGTRVAGSNCQEPVQPANCLSLSHGTVASGKFGACFAYRERGQREMARFDLALSPDGQKLEGKLTSTESGVQAISFQKQP